MGLRELMKIEVEEREPEKVNSLEYLQRIYRDPTQLTPVRMGLQSRPFNSKTQN